jgi:hypothetical protein
MVSDELVVAALLANLSVAYVTPTHGARSLARERILTLVEKKGLYHVTQCGTTRVAGAGELTFWVPRPFSTIGLHVPVLVIEDAHAIDLDQQQEIRMTAAPGPDGKMPVTIYTTTRTTNAPA